MEQARHAPLNVVKKFRSLVRKPKPEMVVKLRCRLCCRKQSQVYEKMRAEVNRDCRDVFPVEKALNLKRAHCFRVYISKFHVFSERGVYKTKLRIAIPERTLLYSLDARLRQKTKAKQKANFAYCDWGIR